MLEDNTLLRQAQAFDQVALARIHDAYYGAIYRYISFHVDDLQTVADLTSEVFTRFLAALRKQAGRPNSIRPWLYGTASRVVKEYYRSRRRRDVVSLDESLAVKQMGPEQTTEKMWVRRQLRQAIQRLTEDQKMVLALRFGENLPIREVATRMNKSEGAVKMLRARAVLALQCQMMERK
ncbi:MAG: sigma-70 family RNA polymerase sigma factor [Anaerolineales bacterium]|nr:MAG: sigma-70 family RNA polymerase sigma factor [Anaerolineales bacterium]